MIPHLLCAIVLSVLAGQDQVESRLDVRVDPRVELMAIIFRLAGAAEYNMAASYPYVRDVEARFRPHQGHAVVELARRLRSARSIGYDAVMSMALHVSDLPELTERVPFDLPPVKLDRRWPLREAREFLERARHFVRMTDFEGFLEEHRELYEETARRLRERLGQRDYLGWLDEFFGKRPAASFHAIPGLLNGGGNYGPSVILADGSEEIYIIIGVWDLDGKRRPRFSRAIVPTVVHEFCHSYVNPVVDAHSQELRPAGEVLFKRVAEVMSRQAYGNWLTMMRESFVRACVVRYLLATDGEAAGRAEILQQQQRGFTWTGPFVELLEDYENNRDGYETFEDFMPDIVEFFADYAHETDPGGGSARPTSADHLDPVTAQ